MKNLFLAFFCLCALTLVAQEGKSPGSVAIKLPTNSTLAELHTYGCFGTCPAFDIVISQTGVLDYDGLNFVEKMGRAKVQLTPTELTQLTEGIVKANLWQYPDTIATKVVDAPYALVVGYDVKGRKSVYGTIDRPQPVLDLEEQIKTLAEAHGLKVKKGVKKRDDHSGGAQTPKKAKSTKSKEPKKSKVSAPPAPSAQPMVKFDKSVKWTLQIANGQPANVKDYGDGLPVLQLDGPEKKYEGSDGCNTLGGKFTLEGTRITFTQPVMTRRSCPNAAASQHFVGDLVKVTQVKKENGRLMLLTGEKLTFVFVAD